MVRADVLKYSIFMKILIDLLTIKKRIHFTTRGAVVEADGSAHFVHDMKLQCGNPFPASVGALAVATRLICVAQFSLQEEHVLDAYRSWHQRMVCFPPTVSLLFVCHKCISVVEAY
jgi:hypothetical protein